MSTVSVPLVPAESRIHASLTAAFERRTLLWLAHRAPAWLTSDQLTLLGLAAQIGAGAAYALARHHPAALLLANLMLILNWFGDSLDGTLARVRNRQRPRYGFYVDHVCDLFGTIAMLSGLALSGLAHGWVSAGMLTCFLLLAGESFLATHTLGRFHLSQGWFGPTELRLLLFAANLKAWLAPVVTILGHRILLYDLGGTIGCACMFLLAILTAVRHTRQLSQQEPLQ
jgi:archaetidylinositol phosphate synthase